MGSAIQNDKEVVLRALLKAGVEANQNVWANAIDTPAEVNIIKILLDPQYNTDQKAFIHAFHKALSNLNKPNNKSKATLFALLDPEIIKQHTNKPLINDGILIAAIHHPTEDLLQKLFESTLTINLTDKEITGLIKPFENEANRAAILKTLLEGLIHQKGQPSIKELLGKKDRRRNKLITINPINHELIEDYPINNNSIIDEIVIKQPTYKPIFIKLGLMEATKTTDKETDEDEIDSDLE